jgi:DNA-binding response OmpR family regulator
MAVAYIKGVVLHILLVEDDDLVASGIVAGLGLHGFTVDRVENGALAQAALGAWNFDAMILDLGLPGEDGMHCLRRWREQGRALPILILTARDAVQHKVEGLQAGADDYLIKPFDLDELVARIHALLRRAAGRSTDSIVYGQLAYTASIGEVLLRGVPVDLSRRELSLLRALLVHPRQILSAEQLRASLYGFDQDVESNAVNVHIHHLRRKLGPESIETVRGVGYRLGKVSA